MNSRQKLQAMIKPRDIREEKNFTIHYYGTHTSVFTPKGILVIQMPQGIGMTHAEMIDEAKIEGFLDQLTPEGIAALDAYRSSL
jgi:hypothetical protein